jgi:asparagine synthase (glutamine-hydrolysing)
MCGISCTVTLHGHGQTRDFRGNKSPQEWYKLERASLGKQIDESLETIKHRGPDDRGYWISDNCRVGLGHVRLSIVDLSADARQPFHDEEGDVHAVVSGEFYDYEKVREELAGKGHKFKSRCDSEIVIAMYKEYGLSFISRLRGEFAFCLYDSKAQFFIAVRDRHGVKPLFYTIHDGKLLIASEMKAFLPYGWQPEWDVQSVMEAGWLSDSRTLFQGVTKIKPGHYLAVQSFGTITQHEYWDHDYPDKVRRVLQPMRSFLINCLA